MKYLIVLVKVEPEVRPFLEKQAFQIYEILKEFSDSYRSDRGINVIPFWTRFNSSFNSVIIYYSVNLNVYKYIHREQGLKPN